MSLTLASATLAAATEEQAAEDLYATGRTDGLPVIVPTERRVLDMLSGAAALEPEMVLGELGPAGGRLTIEKAAINAVMAGCDPVTFPLVVAVCEALCDSRFGAGPIQNTTHCVTPLIIVNGPARLLCGINSGVGALGPGARGNATLGRAARLILLNVGGGVPGVGDMASLGTSAKFTCCLGEAEEASPFEPFHVSEGYDSEDSVVTILGVEGPHSFYFDYGDPEGAADQLLRTLGAALATPGSNNIYYGKGMVAVVLNPLHARTLAKQGWTRADVQQRLFETARMRRDALFALAGERANFGPYDGAVLRAVQRPEDIVLIVAGDDGGAYSAFFPTWGGGPSGNLTISKRVRLDDSCEFPISLRSGTDA